MRFKRLTKEKFIKYLKDKNLYHEVDESLLNDFFFNIDQLDNYKDMLKELWEMSEVDRDPQSLIETSKAINNVQRYYQQVLATVIKMSNTFGITAKARNDLKIAAEDDDGFDD